MSSPGSEPWVFTRRRDSSCNRSIVFVVRKVFQGALGKAKNVSSSSPPSHRLVTTPGQRLAHVRSKVRVGSPGRVSIGRVDDAVEVVADLGERVLRRLPLQVAQLVDAAALHRGPRPDQIDGASQPGVTVDDRQQRRPQPACDESSRHLSRRVLGHAVMQR